MLRSRGKPGKCLHDLQTPTFPTNGKVRWNIHIYPTASRAMRCHHMQKRCKNGAKYVHLVCWLLIGCRCPAWAATRRRPHRPSLASNTAENVRRFLVRSHRQGRGEAGGDPRGVRPQCRQRKCILTTPDHPRSEEHTSEL